MKVRSCSPDGTYLEYQKLGSTASSIGSERRLDVTVNVKLSPSGSQDCCGSNNTTSSLITSIPLVGDVSTIMGALFEISRVIESLAGAFVPSETVNVTTFVPLGRRACTSQSLPNGSLS